ncbi:MAG: cysteate synthase [Bacteroidota bacterium]|nr:cysteate synthase [Bacteroidota bacterium]
MKLEKTNYKLQSVASEKIYDDSGWMLAAPGETTPGFVRTVYEKKQLELKGEAYGLYTFADWMPVQRMLEGSAPPVTYKSEGLAKELGLSNLWITFSGYWPEKGAMMRTCSFKETEAYTVCGRMDNNSDKILVVASAGNTARSFARVCSDNNIPLLLVVPEDYIKDLWFDKPINDCVKLISSKAGSDYYDAIHLSNIAIELDRFFPEGGAKNVARREGMGTTVLSAVTTIGRIPDYYFQAVGSSTGAISAWEANMRFIEDGRYGNNKMKLMVAQNEPFVILQEAWRADSREILPMDDDEARKKVDKIISKVLSNRKPAYSLAGGLYDALKDTGGDVLTVSNEKLLAAAELFKKLEGNDIHSAAATATATLIDAVKNGVVEKDATIMLNITGGGEQRLQNEKELFYLKPAKIFDIDADRDWVSKEIDSLFS